MIIQIDVQCVVPNFYFPLQDCSPRIERRGGPSVLGRIVNKSKAYLSVRFLLLSLRMDWALTTFLWVKNKSTIFAIPYNTSASEYTSFSHSVSMVFNKLWTKFWFHQNNWVPLFLGQHLLYGLTFLDWTLLNVCGLWSIQNPSWFYIIDFLWQTL